MYLAPTHPQPGTSLQGGHLPTLHTLYTRTITPQVPWKLPVK